MVVQKLLLHKEDKIQSHTKKKIRNKKFTKKKLVITLKLIFLNNYKDNHTS